jgi:hypothetical protein
LAGEEILDPFPVFIGYLVTTHGGMLDGIRIANWMTCLTKIT